MIKIYFISYYALRKGYKYLLLMTELDQALLNKEIDKNSASESEMNPKVEKLKYFYKANWFSKLFFNWIGDLISVCFGL
jgi:hypothetical protein